MAGKKIKLEEEAISEIPFADANSESGVEASDVEEYLEEKEKEEEQQQQQQGSVEVAVTNTGQRNHQYNCAAVCVLLAVKEKAQCARCDMDLCVEPCFAEYHTKVIL
jgi:hypothetical protein